MKKPKFLSPIFTLILFGLFTVDNISYAQFGQNKVQYKYFDWKYLQTKHFDVYFSQNGEELAQFTAHEAEKALKNLTENLDYHISNRIPIIVYNSHNDFQQNNVVDQYLPEGVGGVTELFKNRINVPFEGDYEKFRHVIHHELLHAFMNDMYYGGSIQNIISKNISLAFPLWFSEGMAEVQSRYGLDKQTDMYMRDAVINNYNPPLEYMGGYFAYRGGQSFFAWLADTYGEEKLGILMNSIKTYGDVEQGFVETYKMNLAKLNDKWMSYLKKTYWPDLKIREEVKEFAKQLTDHEQDGGYYNVAPVISPDGNKFAYISNRDDLFDVYVAKVKNGEIIKKVIEGNNSSEFEELHILTPGISWSPNGRKLAVAAKAGDHDALYLVDIESEETEELPINLDGIFYVCWAPVGDKIAFIGNKAENSNLYVYDLKTKKLKALTNDPFSDANPIWSLDGKYIFFTSDRGANTDGKSIPKDFKMWNYDYSRSDYYKIDIETHEMTRLSNSKDSKESYAQIAADGKTILYVSDKNGINNVYISKLDSAGNRYDRPITNSLNPIDQISLSKDGKKLLFISLNKGGYDIFSIDNPLERDLGIVELEPTEFVKKMKDYSDKFGREDNPDTLTYHQKDLSDKIDSMAMNNLKQNEALKNNITGNENEVVPTNPDNNPEKSLTENNSATENSTNENSIKKDSVKEAKDTTEKLYGDDVKISFETPKNTSSSLKDTTSYTRNANFNVLDNENPDGTFKTKNYKIKFSPDLVYGNANFTSFYGFQGVAQISLSDMLGNHRIYIQTSMVIDLKNSDYAVAYYYLPKRIDYGFGVYHTARFIYYGNGFYENLYRYRTIGGDVSISYPISRFNRLDANLSVQQISQENLDISTVPVVSKTLIIPGLTYVHDNTTMGYTAPVSGTRYNLTLFGSPKLGSEGIGFASALLDFRNYIKLSDDYTFVARFAGGTSFGPNPQRFFIGGTDNWINFRYANTYLPISDIEDFAFSTPGLPLRGYDYDQLSGSKYTLLNLELRFPLLRYLIFGALPLGFANVEGVAFVDAGTAWTHEEDLQLTQNVNGTLQARDLLVGTGFGARTNLMGFPFKFDIAWGYNLNKFTSPKYYFSLGYNF